MDQSKIAIGLLKWAREHPSEWDVICGFEEAGLERELEIAEMLRDAGWHELCLMMTARMVRLKLFL